MGSGRLSFVTGSAGSAAGAGGAMGYSPSPFFRATSPFDSVFRTVALRALSLYPIPFPYWSLSCRIGSRRGVQCHC